MKVNQLPTSEAEILEAISDGIIAVEPSGHVIFANAAAATLCGYATAAEMLGAAVGDVAERVEITDEDGCRVAPAELFAALPRVPWPSGRLARRRLCFRRIARAEDRADQWVELQTNPVVGPGAALRYVVAVVRDISAQDGSRRRRALLDESGAILRAHTVAPAGTDPALAGPATADDGADPAASGAAGALQAWADHLVRAFVDYCAVDLRSRAGAVRRIATAYGDRAQRSVGDEIAARCPFDPAAGAGVGAVLRSGQSEHHAALADRGGPPVAWGACDRELAEALGFESVIHAPIVERGETIGVLTLATGHGRPDVQPSSRPPLTEADVLLAEELAQGASVSLDNARVHAEAQDAVRSRDELLAIVSHDVRNPLGVVLTGSALLLRGTLPSDKGDRARRQVEAIQRAGHRINALIRDLLDFASIEGGQLALTRRAHDVGGILSEALDSLLPVAASKSQRLDGEAPNPGVAVTCDRDRVVQALVNVMGNSLKFGPSGGQVRVAALAEGPLVRFTVADDGPGMTPEELANLFDRSWQAKRKSREGVGLGLSIVKGIVEAHGGRVWAESAVGDGTRVHFTLPGLSAAAPAPPPA